MNKIKVAWTDLRASPAALFPIPSSKAQYLELLTLIFLRRAFCTPVLHWLGVCTGYVCSSQTFAVSHNRCHYPIVMYFGEEVHGDACINKSYMSRYVIHVFIIRVHIVLSMGQLQLHLLSVRRRKCSGHLVSPHATGKGGSNPHYDWGRKETLSNFPESAHTVDQNYGTLPVTTVSSWSSPLKSLKIMCGRPYHHRTKDQHFAEHPEASLKVCCWHCQPVEGWRQKYLCSRVETLRSNINHSVTNMSCVFLPSVHVTSSTIILPFFYLPYKPCATFYCVQTRNTR